MSSGRGMVKVALPGQTGGVQTSYNYYKPPAVEFPTTAILTNGGSSIPDCQQLTYSAWFKIRSPLSGFGGAPLLQFGYVYLPGQANQNPACSISLDSSSATQVELNSGLAFDSGSSTYYQNFISSGALSSAKLGDWHHLFVAVDVSASFPNSGPQFGAGPVAGGKIALFIDGIQQGTIAVPTGWNVSSGTLNGSASSLPVSGDPIGIPCDSGDSYLTGNTVALQFCDVQIWFGTYIDPTGTYGGGIVVNASQPPTAYPPPVNVGLMQDIVNAALAAGLPPVNVLTAFNMETAYGTQTSGGIQVAYKMPADSYNGDRVNAGIFQMERVDLAVALGGFTYSGSPASWTISDYAGTLINSNDLQTRAYIAATMNPVNPGTQLSYMAGALKWRPADPTGVYAYVAHNQGMSNTSNTGGQDIVLGASSGTNIGSLSIASNMLSQSWSQQAGLTRSSTVGQWLSALTSAWNAAQADAASRLNGTAQNITAFFSRLKTPVQTIVPTLVFGKPTIMFSGDHTTFPTNQGVSGDTFTLTNGPLTDVSGPS